MRVKHNNQTFLLLLCIFALALNGCAIKVEQPIKTSVSTKGMISSAHPLATSAGLEILKKGGSAMDAAIAVSYALAVVYPRAGNIAGGGFLVYRDAFGVVESLDFREMAPAAAHRDMYLDENGELVPGLSLKGPLAVGIPGTVEGLSEAHRKFGKLPFAELLKPAIRLAERGFQITALEAERLNTYKSEFENWNDFKFPFVKKTKWEAGDRLKQTNLGKTLKGIAKNGSSYFYSGLMARQLTEFIRSEGGIITYDDLKTYTSKWRKPIDFTYDNYKVYSMPLPSSGGITMAQILKAISNFDMNSHHSTDDIHLLVEAERRAFADRASHLGDPEFVDVPVNQLMSQTYLRERMSNFDPARATSSDQVTSGSIKIDLESFETTHFSVVDGEGNAVALTTTLNSNYGSKVYFKEGGFFLNNEMDDFSAKPGTPNQFGLVGNEANAIAPGKRMLSSMSPTIIEKNGEFFMALGTPGGSTIITSVVQVFLNVTQYKLSLADAISAPRFHHQWLPDMIFYEDGISEETIHELKTKGHQFKKVKYIGLVDAILQEHKHGPLVGGADPRGDDDARGL